MKLKIAAFLTFLFTAPALLFAGVSFYDLDAHIPSKNEYYSVLSVQSGKPGMLKFKVQSAHASYEVEGMLPLLKLLREIEVIEKIRRNEETSGFFDGVKSSVGATRDGFVKLVKHPIDSGKGLIGAAGKVGRAVGGVFRSKEEGEKSSFSESMLGSAERELAKQFGVDVYTSNPYLRELLTRMARARMGGKSFVFIATFLIPAGAIAIAVTASGLNGAADQVVNDNSRSELYRINRDALMDLKFLQSDAEKFLNSPLYSPREVTYFRTYLEKLQKTAGFRDLLRMLFQLTESTDADNLLHAAQIAAEEVNKNPKIFSRIEVWGDGLKAESADTVYFITPYDYLKNDAHGKSLLGRMEEEKRRSGKKRMELLNAGQIMNDFVVGASLKGLKIRKHVLWGGTSKNENI